MRIVGRQMKRRGFSLVELLVVIGIIALLIAILMPALQKAQAQAKWVQCQSNLRQCGVHLQMYANQWRGWCYPPKLGAGTPKGYRWPVFVFKPAVYNPPEMLCPSDEIDGAGKLIGLAFCEPLIAGWMPACHNFPAHEA